MLIKFKCKIGEDTKTALVRREAITCVIPFGDHTHVYINNLATPLLALAPFDKMEGFLSSAFAEGVLGMGAEPQAVKAESKHERMI